jgi:hypothetical protein
MPRRKTIGKRLPSSARMNPLLSRNFTGGSIIDLPGSSARSEREFVAQLKWRLRSDSYVALQEEIESTMNDRIRAAKYTDIVLTNGKKKRPISMPDSHLMYLQRWILRKLPHHFLSDSVYAYVPGRSAIQCASRHVGMTWGIKIDIASFFHQVREQDVVHLFRSWGFSKSAAIGYAKILTQPVTQISQIVGARPGGRLPQGAPTSGAIANLVCTELDARMERYAELNALVYTRYSDDILLSSKNPMFKRESAAEVLREISSIMKQFGLSLNTSKTRIYGPSAGKHYLGCLIDKDRIRVPRHYRRKVESVSYCLEKFGLQKTEKLYGDRAMEIIIAEEKSSIIGKDVLFADGGKTSHPASHFITRYVGQIVYLHQIDSELALKFARKCLSAIQKEREFFDGHYSEFVTKWVLRSLETVLKIKSPEQDSPF